MAIATSHGSSIRRRASLYTQYATASQKTTPKKMSRFREHDQVRVEEVGERECAIGDDLSDDVADQKREPDHRTDHERGEQEHANR